MEWEKLKKLLVNAIVAAVLAGLGYLVRELGGEGSVPPLDKAARGIRALSGAKV